MVLVWLDFSNTRGATLQIPRGEHMTWRFSKFIFNDKYSVTLEISDCSTTVTWMGLVQKGIKGGAGVSCVRRISRRYFRVFVCERGRRRGRGIETKGLERERVREMANSRCGGFTSYSIPREKCNLSRTLRELSNLNDYDKTPAKEISNAAIGGISYLQF